jgi:hypothetical protein
MNIHINPHNEARVRDAIARRTELMQMYTRDMPPTYQDELVDVNRIIASAVSVAISKPVDAGERYMAMSRGR